MLRRARMLRAVCSGHRELKTAGPGKRKHGRPGNAAYIGVRKTDDRDGDTTMPGTTGRTIPYKSDRPTYNGQKHRLRPTDMATHGNPGLCPFVLGTPEKAPQG